MFCTFSTPIVLWAHKDNMQTTSEFTWEIDAYNGLHVRLEGKTEVQNLRKFLLSQQASKDDFKAIWVYLNTSNLPILDMLVNSQKYQIHHGLGKEIVVYKWLKPIEDLVVPYSIFWIAAGALIIKDNKILLVEEKSGKRKGKYGLPGGRANRGELISQCAKRQLYQQTGIKAQFDRIVFFRELTGQIYNCVDIYYVCLMTLSEQSLEQFKICERQINNYKWVDLTEYEQFCSKNSFGTQLLVSKHVTKLHKENRLFENHHYQKKLDLTKGLCEHRL